MTKPVLVVGSLNMDMVVRAPRHPQVGETIFGTFFNTYPGGKGANQAVAIARLDAAVTMIGKIGSDAFGSELVQIASDEGINTDWISLEPNQPSGIALITVSENGQNTIVVVPGANAYLTVTDLDSARSAFEEAALVVLQLESPLETVLHAAKLAQRNKIPVLLNPAPAQPVPLELLQQVDILIPNQHELLQISGQSEMDSAIEILLGLGVKQLLITLGEEGVILASVNQRLLIPAFKVTAIDTVAAGDAFVGALAVALTRELSLKKAAQFANAAAAISVTRPGAQPSLPTQIEVKKFLKEHLH
jgi:ribokinase